VQARPIKIDVEHPTANCPSEILSIPPGSRDAGNCLQTHMGTLPKAPRWSSLGPRRSTFAGVRDVAENPAPRPAPNIVAGS